MEQINDELIKLEMEIELLESNDKYNSNIILGRLLVEIRGLAIRINNFLGNTKLAIEWGLYKIPQFKVDRSRELRYIIKMFDFYDTLTAFKSRYTLDLIPYKDRCLLEPPIEIFDDIK
jgi:hypothetical protein